MNKQNIFQYTEILPTDYTDEELLSNIDVKVVRYSDMTRRSRRQALINAAFNRGNQWTVLKKSSDSLGNCSK